MSRPGKPTETSKGEAKTGVVEAKSGIEGLPRDVSESMFSSFLNLRELLQVTPSVSKDFKEISEASRKLVRTLDLESVKNKSELHSIMNSYLFKVESEKDKESLLNLAKRASDYLLDDWREFNKSLNAIAKAEGAEENKDNKLQSLIKEHGKTYVEYEAYSSIFGNYDRNSRVTKIILPSCVTDDTLDLLDNFSAVKEISFHSHSNISNDRLGPCLQRLSPRLELLDISECPNIKINSDLIGIISTMRNLKYLDISENDEEYETLVNQENWELLGGMTSLECLNISRHTGIEDMSFLSGLTNLKKLGMDCLGTDGRIRIISQLPQLEEISLFRSDINDDGLRELSNSQSLRVINISSLSITPTGLRHLLNINSLESCGFFGDSDMLLVDYCFLDPSRVYSSEELRQYTDDYFSMRDLAVKHVGLDGENVFDTEEDSYEASFNAIMKYDSELEQKEQEEQEGQEEQEPPKKRRKLHDGDPSFSPKNPESKKPDLDLKGNSR